jgi:hypothetical protein
VEPGCSVRVNGSGFTIKAWIIRARFEWADVEGPIEASVRDLKFTLTEDASRKSRIGRIGLLVGDRQRHFNMWVMGLGGPQVARFLTDARSSAVDSPATSLTPKSEHDERPGKHE